MSGIDWARLALDVRRFDPTPFAGLIADLEASGLRFATLAELGHVEENHRRLYELNRTCSADIPGRGDFYTWPEYRIQRIEVPTFDPRGVVLALDAGRWIGMTALSDRSARGFVFVEMTGVLRSHRGRGIAQALKVQAIPFATACGVTEVRTLHHPDNASAIRANRRIGFTDSGWDPADLRG